MESSAVLLRSTRHPQHEAQHNHHPRHRHRITSHYADRLAPPGLPRTWRVWSGTSHVETGEGVCPSSRGSLSTDTLPVRKGIVWLFLATIAEIPPVVSVANSMSACMLPFHSS